MVEEGKTGEEVLFPEQEVYGVKLSPWTYDQFISMMPLLLKTRQELKVRNILLEDLSKLKEADPDGILQFLVNIIPALPVKEIVSATTSITLDDIKKWKFDKTSSIFLVILVQNAGGLKNFFGLGLTAIKSLRLAA